MRLPTYSTGTRPSGVQSADKICVDLRLETRGLSALWPRLVLAGVLLAVPGDALDPHRAITQYLQSAWATDAGLPQSSVYSIAQTADGYLWAGTELGLARFDGVRFTVFDRRNSKGLAANDVERLLASRDGSLWIGTGSGLTHFLRGAFRTYTTRDGLSGDSVSALCEGRDGSLWVGTGQGLNRLRDGKVRVYRTADGLPGDHVKAVLEDRSGVLWVATEEGLARLDSDRFIAYTARDGLPAGPVTALAQASDGTLWAGTSHGGLAHLDKGRFSIWSKGFPSLEIESLLCDRDGNLWIGFNRHGIGRLRQGRLDLDLYGPREGLPGFDCTNSLFEDRDGNLWIGLLDADLVELRDAPFLCFGQPEGLAAKPVWAGVEGSDGSVWLATDNGDLNRLRDGKLEVYNQRNGLPKLAPYSLLRGRDGSIWVGFRHGALGRIYRGRIQVFHDSQSQDHHITALFENGQGTLWVGTYGSGLARFQSGRFAHVTNSGQVTGIAQGVDGALWIATDGDGVSRLKDGRTVTYTARNGLLSDHAQTVYADPQGAVWVGTMTGGLNRIQDGRITSFAVEQGLFDDTVGNILEDGSGNLWMSCDRGIFRVSKSELNDFAAGRVRSIHSLAFGTADGMRSRDCTFGCTGGAWKTKDGRLWFATMAGAAAIDPRHLALHAPPPQVWFEGLLFDNRPAPVANGARLGPGAGRLEIQFTAPNFAVAPRIQFRYRLVGFDQEWIQAGARRTAYYTNVPPGSYRFQVQAAASDGTWSGKRACLRFELLPHVHQTAWFRALCAAGLMLLGAGIYLLGVRYFIWRNREMDRKVAKRTEELARTARSLATEKSELLRARAALEKLATRDSLTGTWNRAATFDLLGRVLDWCRLAGLPAAVVMCDLDGFKKINDRYGHPAGDVVLQEIARRLLAGVRASDYVGRYGGEEFLIVLPDCSGEEAKMRAEQLRRDIEGSRVEVGGVAFALTCSFGVGYSQNCGFDGEALVREADQALYRAKRAGKNRVEVSEALSVA